MPIQKDSKDLYIHKGNLPASVINGLASYIETGSTIKKISLPVDYGNNLFPNTSEELIVKGSLVRLSGVFQHNNENLKLNSTGYIQLDLYPNVEPFKGFDKIQVNTTNNARLTLSVISKKTDELLYNETINSTNNLAVFDLNNSNIGLEEVLIRITSDSDSTVINNIDLSYNLEAADAENLFKDVNDSKANKNEVIPFINQKVNSFNFNDYVDTGNYFITPVYPDFESITNSPYTVVDTQNFIKNIYLEVRNVEGNIIQTVFINRRTNNPYYNYSVHRRAYNSGGWSVWCDLSQNIEIEEYANGIRIKKDGVYVYSACWGSTVVTIATANTPVSANITFPFTFQGVPMVTVGAVSVNALIQDSSVADNNINGAKIYTNKTSTGTVYTYWVATGK